jgi:hypothetical protein
MADRTPDPSVVDRYPPGSRLREYVERGLVTPSRPDAPSLMDLRAFIRNASKQR